jgi:hypothetical protein
MLRMLVLSALGIAVLPGIATSQEKTEESQIAEAVSPLPEPLRAGAEVRLFVNGQLRTVRQGSNGLICLGDDPVQERWHVACYHESLEPFMARSRELRAQGVTQRAVIDQARTAEVESGKLQMPDGPAALYSLTGEEGSFNPATGNADGATGLYVIYVPYATEATTGVSTVPSRERPWLMSAGKPWAHIMIAR